LTGGKGRTAFVLHSHASYGSFATFSDPDGNGWILQEVTVRLAGRIDSNATTYASTADMASAMLSSA